MEGEPSQGEHLLFRSDMSVELIKSGAADSDVIWAASASTAGEESAAELRRDPERSQGLINFLMRDRHGSPFEHSSMTFLAVASVRGGRLCPDPATRRRRGRSRSRKPTGKAIAEAADCLAFIDAALPGNVSVAEPVRQAAQARKC